MTARWMTRWKPAVGFEILVALADQVLQLGFEVRCQAAPKLVEVHIARPHDGGRVLVIQESEQKVLQRGVLVVPLVGERQRAV